MKPRVAFFDFTGCEGCQLTVIDTLELYPELLDAVEIVQFREAMSDGSDDYQIAFVEGACTRKSDEARLLAIRERAQMVVALGACAHLGGVNALRNWQDLDDVKRTVYGSGGQMIEAGEVRPISAVIAVDAVIPGCPIDREEFARTVRLLLQGRKPVLADYPVCVECRLRENICNYWRGQVCLGPATRAGCGAICPSNGSPCEGCRGLLPNANLTWLKAVMIEHGLGEGDIADQLKLFVSAQVMESEAQGDGRH